MSVKDLIQKLFYTFFWLLFIGWLFQFVATFESLVSPAFITDVHLTPQNFVAFSISAGFIVAVFLFIFIHLSLIKKTSTADIFKLLSSKLASFLFLIAEIGIALYVGIAIFTPPVFHSFIPVFVFIGNGFVAFVLLRMFKEQNLPA